ncbi:PHD finger protein ALFIN-LIKE 1 [Capsicum annuum]|nr:PHD finger protein ALFIN-LIKE 1 [Capsicum annuum]
MASISSSPRSVEEIFKDYNARRAGIVRALTDDVDEFYNLCDPEKENLCLYGHPNEIWEVNLPAEEVPPELPEPALGINFARDGMNRRDWLSLVAVHSDCWLLSVSFYFGAQLNRNESLNVLVVEQGNINVLKNHWKMNLQDGSLILVADIITMHSFGNTLKCNPTMKSGKGRVYPDLTPTFVGLTVETQFPIDLGSKEMFLKRNTKTTR